MSIRDLLKDIKGANNSLKDLIPLNTVNKDNKEKLGAFFTYEEFTEKFPNINTDNIYFNLKDYLATTVYYDEEKFIYTQLPLYTSLQMLKVDDKISEEENLLRIINSVNTLYENKKIHLLLYSFPDAYRFDMFERMVKSSYIDSSIDIFEEY